MKITLINRLTNQVTSYETGLLEISLDYNGTENLPPNNVGHILAVRDIHNLFLQKKINLAQGRGLLKL